MLLHLEVCQLEERRVLNAAPAAAHSGQGSSSNAPGTSTPPGTLLNLDTAPHFSAPWFANSGHGGVAGSPAVSGTHQTGSGNSGSATQGNHAAAASNCASALPPAGLASRAGGGPTQGAGPTLAPLAWWVEGSNGCGRTFAGHEGFPHSFRDSQFAHSEFVSPALRGSERFDFAGAGPAAKTNHQTQSALPNLQSTGTAAATFVTGSTGATSTTPLSNSNIAADNQPTVVDALLGTGPVVTVGGNQTINEGTTVTLVNVTYSDPGNSGPHTIVIKWGEGPLTEYVVDGSSGTITGSHDYTVVGNFPVSVAVINDQNVVGTGNFSVQVLNVPPTINPIANETAGVGAPFTLGGVTFTDPGTKETFTSTINWGDGSPLSIGAVSTTVTPTGTTGSVTGNHVYTTAGIYDGTVTVTDSNGGVGTQNFIVIVGNVAPVLTPLNDVTLDVGNTLSLTNVGFSEALFAGPVQGYTPNFTYTINWGDGSTSSTGGANITQSGGINTQTLGDFSGSHVYSVPGLYTATVTVNDGLGHSTSENFTADVIGTGPVVTVGGNQTINEGTTVTLVNVTYSDPGNSGPHTIVIKWGEGPLTEYVVDGSSGTITGSHDYTVVGNYPVSVAVINDQNVVGTGNFSVQVLNVPPTINPIANETAGVGATFTLGGVTFTDPGTKETFTSTINWGDGSPLSIGAVSTTVTPTGTTGSVTGNHVYTTAGIYDGTVTVTDSNGGVGTQNFIVIVGNVAPVLTPLNDVTLDVGSTLSLTNVGFSEALFAGPVQGYTPNFTYTINWGDGSTSSTGPANITQPGGINTPTLGDFSGSHAYLVPGLYTATVTVNDGLGHSASETFTVDVISPAPVIPPVPTQTVNEGSTLTLTGATFSDADPNGSYTAQIDWGDGTTSLGVVTATATPGTYAISDTHVFATAGTYSASVTVTDINGGLSSTQTFQIVVGNVAPTLNPIANETTNEGSTVGLGTVTFSDPGTLDTHTATVNWGDGSTTDVATVTESPFGPPGSTSGQTGSISDTHVYATFGTYTVTVTVTDNGGLSSTQTFQIVVGNVAPTLNPIANETTNEGSTVGLGTVTFSDPGTLDTHTATVNWGDGSTTDVATVTESPFGPPGSTSGQTGSISDTHVYATFGTYTVTVTVTDNGGLSSTQTFQIVVGNVAPTLNPIANESTIEGSTVGLGTVTFSDPGTLDTHTATVNWGDGSTTDVATVTESPFGPPGSTSGQTGSISDSHVYATFGTYTVTVTVTDNGGLSSTQTFQIVVGNVAPTLNPIANETTNEGSTVGLGTVTFSDPGTLDTHTATVNWGDGSTTDVATVTESPFGPPGSTSGQTGSISDTHVYATFGTYTVTVTVTDNGGLSSTQTFQIVVGNVAPTLNPIANESTIEGSTVGLGTVTFSDPGTLDTHTATVNWGDGSTTDVATVTESPFGPPGSTSGQTGSISDTHVYATFGTYTVTVTVTDNGGLSSTQTFQIVVGNVRPRSTRSPTRRPTKARRSGWARSLSAIRARSTRIPRRSTGATARPPTSRQSPSRHSARPARPAARRAASRTRTCTPRSARTRSRSRSPTTAGFRARRRSRSWSATWRLRSTRSPTRRPTKARRSGWARSLSAIRARSTRIPRRSTGATARPPTSRQSPSRHSARPARPAARRAASRTRTFTPRSARTRSRSP